MRADLNKWWLLPFGILTTSAMIALSIIVFEPAFIGGPGGIAQRAAGKALVMECSGASATDYACYQDLYKGLVGSAGVDAAFDELKDAYGKNEFVKTNCHQITHVIGRAAFDLYDDLPNTYGNGDNFCWSGYYHGAMESVTAKLGPDGIVREANTVCDDLGDNQKYSFFHHNCVHGLGHGFMGVLDNEVFESLETCDTMKDEWEQSSCYGGVFMENIMAASNPSHPSKYLRASQPMYPCTDVKTRHKTECYKMQTSYALQTQDYDFAKGFELCEGIEEDFRTECYQSLGRDASGFNISNPAETKAACMQGEGYEARSNCVMGAARDFVSYHHSDEQAKEFCDSLDAELRSVCRQTAEEYYKIFQA